MAASLNFSSLFTPQTQPQWMSTIVSLLSQLNVPATAWQTGGVARTIVTLFSYLGANEDGAVSLMAQGGFLDFAATGTVTYTSPSNGQVITVPVTPDPSTLSGQALSNWTQGWLDVLSDGSYNVQRIQATSATNVIAFTNTANQSYGPFVAGTFHISNPTTNATYSNTAPFTIAPTSPIGGGIFSVANPNGGSVVITTNTTHALATGSSISITGLLGQTSLNGSWVITVVTATTFSLNGITGNGVACSGIASSKLYGVTTATFAADQAGAGGTSAPNAISALTTTYVGVSCSNTSAFVGSNWESNTALSTRCRLKLQSLSPNGPAGAYQYFALSANQLIQNYKTSDVSATTVTIGTTLNRVKVQSNVANGIVTTTVANVGGVVSGTTNISVTGTNGVASPIIITTATPHNLATGVIAYLSGVGGTTSANGFWQVTSLTATTFSLNGSSGNATWTSGGSIEGGDLGMIDYIIQQNCVPNAITAVTQSAPAQNIPVVATVYVPASQFSAYTIAISAALINYYSVFPIGGLNTDNAFNVLPYNDIIGILYAAGLIAGSSISYVRGITNCTVGGGTTDVSMGLTSVAVLSAQTITVVGQ